MKKIIIVDDSVTVRQQLELVLTQAGYQVVEAEDGLEGLEKIRHHRDAALVLCDINMPRMSGLDMIAEVSALVYAPPPIIMLTTEGQAESIARARRAGVKAWLVKPFKPDQLLATIRKIAR